jgi:hypothetical protein
MSWLGFRPPRFIPRFIRSRAARRVHRLALALPVLVVALYMMLVTAYNLPPSPLKVRLQPALDATVDPYLTQRWRLFAPNPPNGNYDGWLQVEYTVAGQRRTTAVRALTQPLIREAKAHRLFPPRVDRTVINLGYSLTDITTSQIKLERMIKSRQQGRPVTDPADPNRPISPQEAQVLPAGWRQLEGARHMTDDQYLAAARANLAGARAHVTGQLQRVASMLVPGMRLDGAPLRLRVFYTWTPIVRFSERYKAHPEQDPRIRIADTGWLPYLRPER